MRVVASLFLLAGLAAPTAATAGDHHHNDHHHKKTIGLEVLGTYKGTGAEIGAYDAKSKRMFVTNVAAGAVDVIDIRNPAAPDKLFSIVFADPPGAPTSVAVKDGLVAIAVPADTVGTAGTVRFYNADGVHKLTCTVGFLPDMITFTPDGRYVLTANEGEPRTDYVVDPEGSVSIIDVETARKRGRCAVKTAGFAKFNAQKEKLQKAGVRIFGPNATVAQDLEPEYIAISADSKTAWVALQENNAFAIVDIRDAKVEKIVPLGLKNHALSRNKLDPSNQDGGINIANWPVYGMYMPDGIAAYKAGKKTFIVSANEGDAREYDAFAEVRRISSGSYVLDPVAFPNAVALKDPANLGRLNVTTASGDTDGDTDIDKIHAFGARSFSIWSSEGRLVWDSGDAFEQITAARFPAEFNSTNDENGSFDNRSDDKGPEPEGVVLGEIDDETYAFIGLERIGGVMIYNVTDPERPRFVDYVNNRDFAGDVEAGTAGDLAPEGLAFIAAKDSPIRKPLLVVTNEISGTTTIYEVTAERSYAHR